jgi:3-oxoacyl-[acyl-carrier protein] reductase
MNKNEFSSEDLILVTGASSGIGKATALQLNALGAKVVGVARREDKLAELKKECLYPDNFFYVATDLSADIKEIKNIVSNIVADHGKISGFVHSAGTLNPQPLTVLDEIDVLNDFNTNLFSALFLTKAIASRKNKQEKLNIVYVSSITAQIGNPGAVTYGMTKASINSMVSSLAQEIGSKDLRINAVMPGGCDTNMAHAYNDVVSYDYLEKVKEKNLFHEVLQPENVADLITFLLSGKSRWIQGQCIIIDGGETLS